MLKVLWVSEVKPDPNSGAGGTELQMVAHLKKLGHQVTAVWEQDIPRRIRHENLHYAFELPRTYWQVIRREIAKTNHDVVTVNLGQSWLAARELKRRGFRGVFVVRSHGLDDHLETIRRRWLKQLHIDDSQGLRQWVGTALQAVLARQLYNAAKYSDGYVVSNSIDANWLKEQHQMSAEKIAVIPQAPADTFVSSPALPMTAERMKKLLYIANYHFLKDPRTVASAAEQLLAQYPEMEMTWICHANDHDRVKALFSSDAVERVALQGWRSQMELVETLDAHGVFLYPTLFDGFGKIFIEAMSRGLCVVGTRAGGMVDVIQDGESGVLCNLNAPNEIVAAVDRLRSDLVFAQKISVQAASLARQFTWTRVAEELVQFFEHRLSTRSSL